MKIRQGFVSNSSSSSFVCLVCGNSDSVYDMELSEYDMFTCTMGHTVCNEHVASEMQDGFKKHIEEDEDGVYKVPSMYCPICNLNSITDDDMVRYMYIKYNTSYDDVKTEISTKFGEHDEFIQFLKDSEDKNHEN